MEYQIVTNLLLAAQLEVATTGKAGPRTELALKAIDSCIPAWDRNYGIIGRAEAGPKKPSSPASKAR